MKLEQRTHTDEGNMPVVETTQFHIAVNAKAFTLVLDILYTNKVRAVVRELWTNAFDSHIEADMASIPFDVHLPTRLNPAFIVRDYGVSMTHEQVMGLYSTVFESTKDDSNEAVGAFGLGSKSPFSYTSSFTVVARLDGRKRTYLAKLGADGTPEISLIANVEADEAQGIEVSVPCDPEDAGVFEQEAKALAIGFDPLPNIDGAEIAVKEPVYVGENGKFAVFRSGDLAGGAPVHVRQGCVIYPVDKYAVRTNIDKILSNGYGDSYGVVVDVPIGAVGVAANREALSLDERTIETVNTAVESFIETVAKEIQDAVEAQPTRLAAEEYWLGGNDYTQVFHYSPTYRGKQILNTIDLTDDGKFEDDLIKAKQGNRKEEIELKHMSFNYRSQYVFVVKDTSTPVKREMMRYRDYVKGRYGSSNYTYLLVDPTPAQLKRLKRLSGIKDKQIISTADLADPGPPARTSNGDTSAKGVYRVKSYSYYESITEIDPAVNYLWVQVERASGDACRRATNKMETMRALGAFDGRPVYLFTAGAVKRYKPKASNELTRASDNFTRGKLDAWKVEYEEYVYYYQALGQYNAKIIGVTAPTTIIDSGKANAIANLLDTGQKELIASRAQKRAGTTKSKYPLLFNRNDDAAIAEYIAMCDAKAATTTI